MLRCMFSCYEMQCSTVIHGTNITQHLIILGKCSSGEVYISLNVFNTGDTFLVHWCHRAVANNFTEFLPASLYYWSILWSALLVSRVGDL